MVNDLEPVFKLMVQYGMRKLKLSLPDGTILEAESGSIAAMEVRQIDPDEGSSTAEPDELEDAIGASAAMPGSVYEDPDLYPDGIDPVAEIQENMRIRGAAYAR